MAAAAADDEAGEEGASRELGLLARLACKLALPRLKHAIGYSWQVPFASL